MEKMIKVWKAALRPKAALALLAAATLLCTTLKAQQFYANGGLIPNNLTPTTFTQTVSGVGALNGTNGLVRVCLSIDQARPADMDIFLISPSGVTVELSTDNGGTSGNDYYYGLCFSDCGPSGGITLGTNFRGVYSPEQPLSGINNGSSGDGTWQLRITDDNVSGTDGVLNFWSLDFGGTARPALPIGETCATAFALTSLPYSHTCMTLAGTVDNYSACNSNMEGSEYVYTYTPTTADEYLSIDVAQDFSTPSGFPTISLLDTCPDVAVASNCLQTEIQFNSTENILNITSVPLVQGKTYYIVIASTSGTGGVYDIRVAMGRNANDDCFNATVIDHQGEYAGNNYNATIPSTQAPNGLEMSCNGAIDNFVFYTFTTDGSGSTVHFAFTDVACDLSCGGACGIQVALFQAPVGGPCLGPGTWGPAVFCETSIESNTYYHWSGLSPNTQYYLLVDGNAGSQCVWNLYASGGFNQVTLPIEMESMQVVATNSGNEIKWKTISEVNVNHFEVEHATVLPNFEEVGRKPSNPNGSGSYDYLHTAPAEGWHYYRLKVVDADGSFHYSAIKSIYVGAAGPKYQLLPNPAKNFVQLMHADDQPMFVEIYGLDGKLWKQIDLGSSKSQSQTWIDLEGMPIGIYLMRVTSAQGTKETLKFSISY